MRREWERLAEELEKRKAIFDRKELTNYLAIYSREIVENLGLDSNIVGGLRTEVERNLGRSLLNYVNSQYEKCSGEMILPFPSEHQIIIEARGEFHYGSGKNSIHPNNS